MPHLLQELLLLRHSRLLGLLQACPPERVVEVLPSLQAAAVLHLLTAVTVLAVIQLVEGGAEELVKLEEGDSLLYGYSYLLAWSTFLASLAASIVFLAASRKRKLLDSDNVNFTHHKLDISVSQQSSS